MKGQRNIAIMLARPISSHNFLTGVNNSKDIFQYFLTDAWAFWTEWKVISLVNIFLSKLYVQRSNSQDW